MNAEVADQEGIVIPNETDPQLAEDWEAIRAAALRSLREDLAIATAASFSRTGQIDTLERRIHLIEKAVFLSFAPLVQPVAPTGPQPWGVCPNCQQWQWPPYGDCLHECAKRGFAAAAAPKEV